MYRFLEEKMRSYECEVALLFETKCVGSIIHTRAHTHVHACIHMHMDTCMHACMRTCTPPPHTALLLDWLMFRVSGERVPLTLTLRDAQPDSIPSFYSRQ